MKDLFFNDLSITPLCNNDDEVSVRINSYVQILKFCGLLGFKKVRYEHSIHSIELKKDYTFHDYIIHHGKDDSLKLIFSMARKPYIDDDTPEEERFVNTLIKLNKNNNEIDAEGLTCAYLAKSFAIGFTSEPFWKNNILFELSEFDQINKISKKNKVFCISQLNQFEIVDFINYIVNSFHLAFNDCGLRKEDKAVHIRNDHGNDKLKDFADKILKEVYIIKVVNSLPFSPSSKDIIGKISDNGLIEIRLKDSTKGLGLVVQTTAKSYREALYMAADIRKKYG